MSSVLNSSSGDGDNIAVNINNRHGGEGADTNIIFQQIAANTRFIQQHMNTISRLQDQLSTAQTFNVERLRKHLHDTLQSANGIVQQTNALVQQQFHEPLTRARSSVGGNVLNGMRNFQRQRVLNEFNDTFKEYKTLYEEVNRHKHVELQRARAESTAAVAAAAAVDSGSGVNTARSINAGFVMHENDSDEEEEEEENSQGKKINVEQQRQQQHLQLVAQQSVAEFRARQEEVTKIERDLADLATIFTDLNLIVREQGEQITVIEENVEAAREQVEPATEQIAVAHAYHRAARRKQWTCFALVAGALVVLVVVLIVVGVLRKSS